MSSPTVLFVLKKLLDRGLPERVLMTAFGPGFTCAGLIVDRTRGRRRAGFHPRHESIREPAAEHLADRVDGA